jgi:hypothetical protein
MKIGRLLLIVAGCLSSCLAVLHVAIVFVGGPGYRYFGAGESIARQAEEGSMYPVFLTLFVAAVLVLFGLYAFSGADVIRRLPLIKTGLLIVGSIYFLRGLLVIFQVARLLEMRRPLVHRAVLFSMVSLSLGLTYLVGTGLRWKSVGLKTTLPTDHERSE